MSAGRALVGGLAALIAVTSLLVGAVALYAERTLFDSDRFTDHAVSVLDDEEVRSETGAAIADAAVEQAPDATAARPAIEAATTEVARSPALRSLLASGVAELHEAAVERNQATVMLTLTDVGGILRGSLEEVSPEVARRTPSGLDVQLLGDGEALPVDAGQIADGLRVLPWVGGLAFLLVAALSIGLASTPLAGIRRVGWVMAGGAIAGVAIWFVARVMLSQRFEASRPDVIGAIYDAFLVDLRTWLLILAGTGLVLTVGGNRSPDAPLRQSSS